METHEQRGTTIEEREYYSLSARVYSKLAPFYDLTVYGIRPLRREVAALTDVGAGSRVLDVATGTGEAALAFAENGAEVVGVDLSEAMLRVARRKNRFRKLSFVHADAAQLPLSDASFDVACICFALHEMPESVRERILHEMARVTKPGGKLVVVDYALPPGRLARSVVYHLVKLYERDAYADFVRRDVAALIEGAGFRACESRAKYFGGARIWLGLKPGDRDARAA